MQAITYAQQELCDLIELTQLYSVIRENGAGVVIQRLLMSAANFTLSPKEEHGCRELSPKVPVDTL